MGRVHLVGPQEAGLAGSPPAPPRSRGLRDLAIAIVAGALIWLGDRATGRHLERALAALTVRLSVWYEERRRPVVTCLAGRPVEYRKLEGVIFKVPECWRVEVSSLLDREVHRFHDPEARAGTLSISLEPAETEEDAGALRAEFERLARRPGAVVDGVRRAGTAGPSIAPEASLRPSGFDGQAERILHPETNAPNQETNGTAREPATAPHHETNGAAGGTATHAPEDARGASAGARLFHRVEVGGLVGPLDQEGSARSPGSDHAKRTWNWLLIGDRVAVRMTYGVRADWADSPVVAEEFKRVEAVANSITPAP